MMEIIAIVVLESIYAFYNPVVGNEIPAAVFLYLEKNFSLYINLFSYHNLLTVSTKKSTTPKKGGTTHGKKIDLRAAVPEIIDAILILAEAVSKLKEQMKLGRGASEDAIEISGFYML